MRPCPTCPALTKTGRCETCKARRRRASRRRNPRTDTHYSTARWQRARREQLQRQPTCATPGCDASATDVDHNPPLRQLAAQGISNPDHPRWLTSLCHSCHSRKTAAEDGGFGRAPRQRFE